MGKVSLDQFKSISLQDFLPHVCMDSPSLVAARPKEGCEEKAKGIPYIINTLKHIKFRV